MYKYLLVTVLRKISVRLEIEEMQLREVKKDLGNEFSILEDGIFAVLVICWLTQA